ncbi:MAG: ABC transporter [Clostridiales bacterium]|nr:ABC transporter [Clostridiales bacterium]
MTAVLRREFTSYFSSPIGYVFLAVFFAFSGFFLYITTLQTGTVNITSVFSQMFTILIFLIPILTMRLLSEDKKQKTDQVLLTAPLSLTGLVVGKFLAAFFIFALGVSVMLLYAVVLSAFATIEWTVFFGNIIGLLLLGGALISVGLFVSGLTENQVVAAVGSFAIMMLLMLIDMIAGAIPIKFISDLIYKISFFDKYNEFTVGIFNFANILFFLSFMVVFLFLTIRALEKRRWS